MSARVGATWTTRAGRLEVKEPLPAEVSAVAGELAALYNEPENAALLGNTIRFEPQDVVELWRDVAAEGGRPMLLLREGELVGDAAFKPTNASDGLSAELGLLVGPPALQGQGLGARFAVLLLTVACGPLGLQRVYVSIRPENARSIRLFERLGFERDDSPDGRARAGVESDDEVSMVLCLAALGGLIARRASELGDVEEIEVT